MRLALLAATTFLALTAAPAQASLIGQTFGVKLSYMSFGSPPATTSLLTQSVTAHAGVEIDNLPITYSYMAGGFPQTMNGTLDIDIGENTLILSFTGFSVLSSLDIELVAPTGGVFTAATRTAESGFTPGSNQPGLLRFTANSVKTGYFFLGSDIGTQSQTITLGFTPPVPNEVPAPGALGLLGLGMLGLAGLRRRTA